MDLSLDLDEPARLASPIMSQSLSDEGETFRRVTLPPLESDGTVVKWVSMWRRWF